MTIQYTQTIQSLPSYKEIDGNSDVVFSVNWFLVGTEGVFSSNYPMATNVPYVAGQPFIPYADLTESDVYAWIDEYTDPNLLEMARSGVQSAIVEQQTIATPPLPWLPPPEPT